MMEPGLNASATTARRLYWERRRRDESLDRDLFGEPGWDLLLDLFIARTEGRSVSILSAGIDASIGVAEAGRWIRRLQDCGMVEPLPDTPDPLGTPVTLSDAAYERIAFYLKSLERSTAA